MKAPAPDKPILSAKDSRVYRVRAPGKLILSGEHSVVYGAPALALAVAQNVVAEFTRTSDTQLSVVSHALGEFSIQLDELPKLKARLDQRFQAFQQNLIAIAELLNGPEELLFYTLAVANFQQPGRIDINSQLPTGAGMGSSAAVIAALLCLADAESGETSNQADLIQRIRYCERLQHGRGSALDASAIVSGGVTFLHKNQPQALNAAVDEHWYIWHSGQPLSSTGEVVEQVRQQFAKTDIWSDFAEVTEQFKQALLCVDAEKIVAAIRQNQHLLRQIGVVPDAVATQINQLEQAGCAAKICGAGAVQGDNAGLVLIYIPQANAADVATRIGKELSIELQPLMQSQQGVHIIYD